MPGIYEAMRLTLPLSCGGHDEAGLTPAAGVHNCGDVCWSAQTGWLVGGSAVHGEISIFMNYYICSN